MIMNEIIRVIFAINLCNFVISFTSAYPNSESYNLPKYEVFEDPLMLTSLIENGSIDFAREKAEVQHQEMECIKSYAGYFTVNKKYNSNLFFWFFPAQTDPENSPVVLWLQGGPGASSMFGLFAENGPFSVTKNQTLKTREYSWSVNHNLLYIDNPVGTGYSFTENNLGYATNETDVGRDLLSALIQFFNLFPELRPNEFYATGESYAGKYVPAISLAIKNHNEKAKTKINLQGLAIGNGLSDPYHQFVYSDYFYQIGLLDFNGRDQFKQLENRARDLIKLGKHEEAFKIFGEMINNDPIEEPTLFKNLTGFDNWYNYLYTQNPDDSEYYYTEWIERPDVRKAIHVGNRTFISYNMIVVEYLKEDFTKSVAFIIADLLEHYQVLLYSGQLDLIVPYRSTENYLLNLNWSGIEDYKKTPRKQWKVGNDLAGYSKTVRNLTEVLVRNAGHMVPADQPMWAWELITRFTHKKQE